MKCIHCNAWPIDGLLQISSPVTPTPMADSHNTSTPNPRVHCPRTPASLTLPFLREGSNVSERKPPQTGEPLSPLPTKRTRTYSAWVPVSPCGSVKQESYLWVFKASVHRFFILVLCQIRESQIRTCLQGSVQELFKIAGSWIHSPLPWRRRHICSHLWVSEETHRHTNAFVLCHCLGFLRYCGNFWQLIQLCVR